VKTWTFPGGGGDPWDDLWEDQPWRDLAIEADQEQDAAERARLVAELAAELHTNPTRAEVLLERFGHPDDLAGEATAGPVRPIPAGLPPRWIAADPAALVDRPLVCAERRRRLNEALTDDRLARPTEGAA
jgi:hypothetical protein